MVDTESQHGFFKNVISIIHLIFGKVKKNFKKITFMKGQ